MKKEEKKKSEYANEETGARGRKASFFFFSLYSDVGKGVATNYQLIFKN